MLRSLAYSPILSALGATLLLTAFGGCGAGDVSPPPPLADAGTDSPTTTDAPPGATTQTGKIIDLSTKSAIADAKITTGTFTATTDAKGNYSVQVDPTQPFNMHVEKTGYYTLIEQSTLVKTSFNLGNTSFLSENTANLLTQTLPGFDPTLAAVSTDIEIRGGCTDETGATFDFTVDGQPPPANAHLVYFSSDFPAPSNTAAESNTFPHGIIYNLPGGKPVTVTVKHPKCTMLPFPVDKDVSQDPRASGVGTVTYVSATLTPVAGKATGFLRLFLQ